MSALMFIQADIKDPEKFVEYAKRAPQLIEKFGGRYRAMRSTVDQLEGTPDHRKMVVSEWPSMEAGRKFWDSPEYAELKAIRDGAAEINVYLIELNCD